MNKNSLTYQYLSDSIPFQRDGKTLLSLGFYITFYFGNCDTQENRQAIVQLCNEYQALCGEHLKWQTHPTNSNWKSIKEDYSPEHWILKNPEDRAVWQVTRHGGKTFDESSPYRLETIGYPDPGRRLSYFTVGLPFDWFADPNREGPVEMVTRWAGILKPLHGTAGITVMSSMHRSLEMSTAKDVYALAKRFPGLEYNDPSSHALYAKKAIKSVNWLTVINDQFVEQLGGVDKLANTLAEDDAVQLHSYSDGVVVQAGPHPEIGDVNLKLFPEHYKTVNKAMKTIRIGEEHKPFIGFGHEETQKWLARFD